MAYSLIYVSRAIEAPTRPRLMELLAVWRSRNSELGITGLLLYRDKSYMQLLEGPQDVVINLYDKIKVDARHGDVRTLSIRRSAHPQFPSRAMAFQDLDESVTSPGYNDALSTPAAADKRRYRKQPQQPKQPDVVVEILALFKTAAQQQA